MSKRIISFSLLLAILIACNKKEKQIEDEHVAHMKMHKEMDKVDREFKIFNDSLAQLYNKAQKDPEVILIKADSLLAVNKSETDRYKSQIRSHIGNSLNYLKAELYYKIGKYDNSLAILLAKERHLYGYIMGNDALAIAANYTKLKQFDKARPFIDSIRKGYYLYDYALGNYYETVGDKNNALKIYEQIRQDKHIKHYAYYKLAVERYAELSKNNPKLLNELYFPTGNPSYEICDSDSKNRTKIFKLIANIPECKGYGVHIFESPQVNDKDYYWIKISDNSNNFIDLNKDYDAKYNFLIYPKDFSIKHYNPQTKALLTLDEWRKTRPR